MARRAYFFLLLSLVPFTWAYTDCSNYTVKSIDQLPPAWLQGLDTSFYKKFVSSFTGVPIMSSNDVTDYALKESARIIDGITRNLLPGYLPAILNRTERIAMWGPDEQFLDLPEVASDPTDFPPDQWAGFSGGVAWNNILALQQTSFDCDARGNAWIGRVLIHEFSHAVNFVFPVVSPGLQKQVDQAYVHAWKNQIWPQGEYAMTDPYEYFAIGSQTWFDANEVRHCLDGACNKQQLENKDVELYDVVAQAWGGPDWLYRCSQFCDPNTNAVPKAPTKPMKSAFGRRKKVIRDDYSKMHG